MALTLKKDPLRGRYIAWLHAPVWALFQFINKEVHISIDLYVK
jgi:hypothetical protein